MSDGAQKHPLDENQDGARFPKRRLDEKGHSLAMRSPTQKQLGHENYTIGVVCALEFEMSAVRYMLAREHPSLQPVRGDPNLYVLGELSGHNVVISCLPGSQGKGAAATVTTNMARTFPDMRLYLLVGIGGGVPSEEHDIRLGDVVMW